MIIPNQLLTKKNIINNTPPRNKGRLLITNKRRKPHMKLINQNLRNIFVNHNTTRNRHEFFYTLSPTSFRNASNNISIHSIWKILGVEWATPCLGLKLTKKWGLVLIPLTHSQSFSTLPLHVSYSLIYLS